MGYFVKVECYGVDNKLINFEVFRIFLWEGIW